MPLVQFNPLTSQVSPQFWHHLCTLKIDVLRLSSDSIPVVASYSAGRSVVDRETGQEIGLGCVLSVSGEGLQKDQPSSTSLNAVARGSLTNFNTIEEFKASDKTALFNQVADEIWASFDTDSPDLNKFLLLTFADLKKYRFYYWFAFPAFAASPSWQAGDQGFVAAQDGLSAKSLENVLTLLKSDDSSFFLVRNPLSANPEIAPITSYATFFASVPESERTIAFLDPSSSPQNPGWPLRNLLAYLQHKFPDVKSHRVLCWRDTELPAAGKAWKSRFAVLSVEETTKTEVAKARPNAVGWEKNAQGKLGARMADLGSSMDPIRLADQALSLNLKLMRWRILPSLDLDKVAATKVLLLGAGTLGCYVARTLMAWGVNTITFVDSARVSFSNPVRQPLFEFEDCLEGGQPKAECAAKRMKKIYPGINATGHSMSIPMPGHPIPPNLVDQTHADVQKLEKLIEEHDAVFLLMDSRESRWLPTVIAGAKGKIVMNAALGFDTYLVMRHGSRSTNSPTKLGCYYCNDIVAPSDSLTDRTLDQMCTVTRPGLASIASSTAVEMLVSTIQHPEGINAPAPPIDKSGTATELSSDSQGQSILGLVPHQIRGYLAQFRNLLITGQKYDKCTGCSETVLKAYETQGFPMLLRAFNETGFLENLTGLDKLYDEGEAALESVDWAEGDEGEDF